jgi:hypothetical protein
MSTVMTTPTTDDARPGPGEPDLQLRIRERRAALLGKLSELTTDRRIEAAEARHHVKLMLSELAHIVKWGVADGWANVGEPVTQKLEQWLAGSARQLAAERQPS